MLIATKEVGHMASEKPFEEESLKAREKG